MGPSVRICYTVVDMHLDRFSVLDKDLSEEHASDLACVDVGIWNEVSVRPIGACPAETKSFFFCGTMLDKDVALTGYFSFDSASK
jgi:hypothetical protein